MIFSYAAMAGYFLLFAIIHSFLADNRTKRAIARILGAAAVRWYRLAFVIFAFASILPFIFILAYMPDRVVYSVPPPWWWLMVAGQIIAAVGVVAAVSQTGFMSFLGVEALFKSRYQKAANLVTYGLYCHVRNPVFLLGAAFLWLFPTVTGNLLIFNILATAYFYLGALHEERALWEEFRQEYEEYKRKVPMFLPRIRC